MGVSSYNLGTSAAAWTLLVLSGLIFNTMIFNIPRLEAMEPEYVVARLTGTAPQSAPIPHLPTRFLREGQVVSLGEDYLMLPDTSVVLAAREAGGFHGGLFTVNGPNRIRITGDGLEVTDPAGLIRHEKAYFADPASAVELISRLLVEGNWLELALYYDLDDDEISPATLLSGAFFKREVPPEVGHPGISNRFKEPFSPSFSYASHFTEGNDEVRVTVDIEIDQGGGMVQEGRDTFSLRRTEHGYRLLPKRKEAPSDFIPTTVQ